MLQVVPFHVFVFAVRSATVRRALIAAASWAVIGTSACKSRDAHRVDSVAVESARAESARAQSARATDIDSKPAGTGASTPDSGSAPPPGSARGATGRGNAASSSPRPTAPAVERDTARGIVRRVGNDPVSVMVLESGASSARTTIALHGQRELLQRIEGLEVMVRGTLTTRFDAQAAPRGARIFNVAHFEVRAADGVTAIDGVLQSASGVFYLVTQQGRRIDVANIPTELRNQVGARVFLAGSMQSPSAFGIIAPRR